MWTDHLANKVDELRYWRLPIRWQLLESWAKGVRPLFVQHLRGHLEAFERATERPEPIGGLRARAVSPAQAGRPQPPPRYDQAAIDEVWRSTIEFMDGVLAAMDTEPFFPNGPTEPKSHAEAKHVFLGHGRSEQWRQLSAFLAGLGMQVEEFNRSESPAGKTNSEHVTDLLDRSHFAFLAYTAEDEQPDGSTRARQNVVEETGRCIDRFGARRAIVLLEAGCMRPTNLDGVNEVRFAKGRIDQAFPEVRAVLQREGML